MDLLWIICFCFALFSRAFVSMGNSDQYHTHNTITGYPGAIPMLILAAVVVMAVALGC